jgi:hypothetical protein
MSRSLLVVALLLGASHSVFAGAVFVVSVGEPSSETGQLLAPIIDELEHQPMYALPATISARLGDRVPRSGLADTRLQVADLVGMYEAGCQLFKNGKWQAAADKLADAVRKAQENSLLLVDRAHHDTWMAGQVALAMSRFRQHDLDGSEEANEELVRSFPNHEAAIRSSYGTEAARHYADAQSTLDAKGRGILIVDVNDPTALVDVNEWGRPQNGSFQTEAFPGTYRVLVRMPGTNGLRYSVSVQPNETTHLSIDLKFDGGIRITDQFVGFVFASEGERDRNAIDHARRLAKAITADNNLVILVSLTRLAGRLAVTGTVYRLDTGGWVRGRAVQLDGRDDEHKLRSLAHATMRSQIEDRFIVALPDPTPRPAAPPRPRRWPKWAAAAGAAVTLVTGGSLVYLHDSCATEAGDCKGVSRSAVAGYFGIATGLALGTFATYLFLHDASESHVPRITVAPSRSGAILGLAATF